MSAVFYFAFSLHAGLPNSQVLSPTLPGALVLIVLQPSGILRSSPVFKAGVEREPAFDCFFKKKERKQAVVLYNPLT